MKTFPELQTQCANTAMHTSTEVHTHACKHACTHARTHACTHARTHACTHTRTHACTHTHTLTLVHVCVCVRATALSRCVSVTVEHSARSPSCTTSLLCCGVVGHVLEAPSGNKLAKRPMLYAITGLRERCALELTPSMSEQFISRTRPTLLCVNKRFSLWKILIYRLHRSDV